MVGIDTGGNVSIQSLVGEAGGVTVDLLVMGLRGDDFRHGGIVGTDDTGEVHHFCQTKNSGMVEKTVNILVVQIGTAFIQRGSGDAGGNHK